MPTNQLDLHDRLPDLLSGERTFRLQKIALQERVVLYSERISSFYSPFLCLLSQHDLYYFMQ